MDFKSILKDPLYIVSSALLCIVIALSVAMLFGADNNIAAGTSSAHISSNSGDISGETSSTASEAEKISFKVTSPTANSLTVTDSFYVFKGTCNPADTLYINGKRITPAADGSFSCDVDLKVGKNAITVQHGSDKTVYNVTYRYIILKSISPDKNSTFDGGSTMVVRATARYGSTVTAKFNGKTITLTQEFLNADAVKPEFIGYIGSFDLPKGAETSKSLGAVTFTAKHSSGTETFKSGTITVKKNSLIQTDGTAVTPVGGQYMPVSGNVIAEIVCDSAETFDGKTVDDMSRPTNNYLPKGTVDYCSTSTIRDPSSGRTYRRLRCGKRVYEMIDNDSSKKFIKTYVADENNPLPKTNSLAINYFDDTQRHTIITLDTLWKAPFYFDLKPLNYYNAAIRDYRFDKETYSYVDITFCYAETLTLGGEMDASNLINKNNPLFSRAEIIKNKNDCTLRLHLKNVGKFYGWSAEYNEAGQLVFKFLHPAVVAETDTNEYGADLSKTTVFIDVGHGGSDPGAVASDNRTTEANLNLKLALMLKAELEKTGCHVIIDRISNIDLESADRIKMVKEYSPDLVISIHRNASTSSRVKGFNTYYFHPYSRAANKAVYDQTIAAGLYTSPTHSKVDWHYFFLGRVSDCPVILAENGFMSNSTELANMKNDAFNKKCAVAMTKGVVEYFLENAPITVPDDEEESSNISSSESSENSSQEESSEVKSE
ncbi:MAG: N-acetylmuramoyl-L-alanine amidase [Ruminococcaceae bacterium]|nr:N-acetylmuramoyl-L-alanine amidase [Oscillospiraceae bacterium]